MDTNEHDFSVFEQLDNYDYEMRGVDVEQVPSIISKEFSKLKSLQKNVQVATQKAETAKTTAENAKSKSAGAFHRKATIESLQEATADLADAQMSAAQAQELSFEYQQALGEMIKRCMAMGVTNIAMNRCVVRELELKLRGASAAELDELARQEIIAVVKQLKAQEDFMKKQSDLLEKVKAHDVKLKSQEEIDDELAKRIQVNTDTNNNQDAEIIRQDRVDKELERRIDIGEANDQKQDAEIARQAEVDKILEQRMDGKDVKDQNQDIEIARQAEVDKVLEQRMDNKDVKDNDQDIEIARQAEVDRKLENRIGECELSIQQLIDKNTNNEQRIALLEQSNEMLNQELAAKANKTGNVVAVVISIVALVLSILQFII